MFLKKFQLKFLLLIFINVFILGCSCENIHLKDIFKQKEFIPKKIIKEKIENISYFIPNNVWIEHYEYDKNNNYKIYVYNSFDDDYNTLLSVGNENLSADLGKEMNYSNIKTRIIDNSGYIKEEKSVYFNGLEWFYIKTDEYKVQNKYYYDILYLYIPDKCDKFYFVEANIENDIVNKKYVEDSVSFVVNNYKF